MSDSEHLTNDESEHSGGEDVSDTMEATEAKDTSKKTAPHPTYVKMLVEAVGELQVRQTGVSRAKVVEYITSKYKIEVNANALKKAAKVAEEKELIENKTGNGLSGSYVLTKKEKTLQAKKSNSNIKSTDKPAASKDTKSKPKPSKPASETVKKDTKKKPPLPKGKENKDTKEKPTKKDAPSKAPAKKTLAKTKSNSEMEVDEAGPSKARGATRKPPAAKKGKTAAK